MAKSYDLEGPELKAGYVRVWRITRRPAAHGGSEAAFLDLPANSQLVPLYERKLNERGTDILKIEKGDSGKAKKGDA